MLKNQINIVMFVCTTVFYKSLESLRNDIHNLSYNTHVQIELDQQFYHGIVYIADEEGHNRITHTMMKYPIEGNM